MKRGKNIHLIANESLTFFSGNINVAKNGNINEGIMTEPRVNNKPTTEGRIYAKDKDIIALMIKPNLMKYTIFFLLSLLGEIFQKISLPIVSALIKLSESIVDIIIAIIPVINSPKKPIGRKSIARVGKVKRGFSIFSWFIAYNPQKMVRVSKMAQKIIAVKIPFLATSGFSAAADLW